MDRPSVDRRTATLELHTSGSRERDRVDHHRRPTRRGDLDLETSHSRFYWGMKLILVTTADGTVTGFGLASPKLAGEREQTCTMLAAQPGNQPAPGTVLVADKGFAGKDFEEFFTDELGLLLVRPARKDEKPRAFLNWLRQRVEAIIRTLKNQLGLEQHGDRVPAGLWTRIVQRLLALNAAIWHNWNIGARSSGH